MSEPLPDSRLDLDLRFPSDPRLLRTIRSMVGQMAGVSGFQDDEAQFIMLAVDEACANVIRHAYGGKTDGEMCLSCRATEGRIEIRLLDKGRAPRLDRIEAHDIEPLRPGGLGLHIIRSVMDEVRFGGGENGNELYLAKSLRPQRQAVSAGSHLAAEPPLLRGGPKAIESLPE